MGLWPEPRSERSAAFLHLWVCGQNRRVKGARPSFTSGFVAQTETCKERGLSSPLGLWPKPRSERSAAFLHLSVCGQNQAVTGVGWSAAFLHLSVCGPNRGVKGARPCFTVCGRNRGVKGARPSCTPRIVSERSAAFLHLSDCGQNRGVKGARPSFTSRFVAKTEG